MSKDLLKDAINIVNKDIQEAESEIKAVNAAAEYITLAEEKGEEKLDNKEVAEALNAEYATDLTGQDIEKIENVVEAERDGDIENVGWDKQENDIDMQKINEIYEENKEAFEEKEEKKNIIENIAEDAFAEMTDGLKNSENVFDSAIGEMYDRWREEYLEEKEAEKEQEIEEAYNEGEKENEQENDKNIEQEAQESGQKEQNEAEFAEAQAKEAAEAVAEMDAGMSM